MKYPSIRIEGNILSPDILERLEELQGQRPQDFGFDSDTKVKDEIAHAWAGAQQYWKIFQHKLESKTSDSPATTETRQMWMAPFLGLLGYELEYQARGTELSGKLYTISHHAVNCLNAPVQIIGYNEPAGLDRKPERVQLRMSAHAIVQEFLNLNDQLFGIVTNGHILRLLRDSSRLIKLSYLEFDLDRIFTDGLFADFAVLYRLLHATRLASTSDSAAQSLIERYHQDVIEQGTRIRDGLSAAVEDSLRMLGTGFITYKHANNEKLRESVRSGELTPSKYYNYLLRLIYRLLFLNVIEERGLIFPSGSSRPMQKLYRDCYSVQRLRKLALTRGLRNKRHHDAWLSLLATFEIFERPEQAAKFETTALGGRLFDPDSLGPLSDCHISNKDFFEALDRLSSFEDRKTKQQVPVNFGALATEELGSVYEGLLDLHPYFDPDLQYFGFRKGAGSERKTSGSYYTPSSLVDCLIESALIPVLDERIKSFKSQGYKTAEEAVLDLKVCDPACGSGHFLIAAAQRIARRLALLRAGDDEPSPDQQRHALREVISHCIYGVDLNPMAVELCKVALWLEAMEPGKPLSFLDMHIKCGNSLLGTTPKLMEDGIPDEAFKVLEGDDKKWVSYLKKRNKEEREGIQHLFGEKLEPGEQQSNLPAAMLQIDVMNEESIEGVEAKRQRYVELVNSADYKNAKLLADAWCAAFVWIKRKDLHPAITHKVFKEIRKSPYNVDPGVRDEIKRLADQYRFFHWHLEFPDIFPPDETLTLVGKGVEQ